VLPVPEQEGVENEPEPTLLLKITLPFGVVDPLVLVTTAEQLAELPKLIESVQVNPVVVVAVASAILKLTDICELSLNQQ